MFWRFVLFPVHTSRLQVIASFERYCTIPTIHTNLRDQGVITTHLEAVSREECSEYRTGLKPGELSAFINHNERYS